MPKKNSKDTGSGKAGSGKGVFPGIHRSFEGLFESTRDIVQVFAPDGTLLKVNKAWHNTLEYSRESVSGLSFFSIVHSDHLEPCRKSLQKALQEKETQRLEVSLVSKTGREVKAEGAIHVAELEDGSSVFLAILHDTTAHKRHEALKDEFIGAVSHELRTPLTVVREGTAQLRDGLLGEMTDEQKSLLDMVLQNIDRLSRIINELLDVSKLESGQVQIRRTLCNIADPVGIVVANFQPVARKKGLELKVESPPGVIEVYLDQDKFIQVLTNLVANALKFTQKGHVRIGLREIEGFVECTITDTGRGISGEDLPNLFEKFRQFSRVPGPGDMGTGLGLAICKKLIELHHGKISAESVPMKGTKVTILLPRYTSREIFREYIGEALHRCADEGGTLSLIVFDIVDFSTHQKNLGEKQLKEVVGRMEKLINESLRRSADVAIKDKKAILVLLPDTKKENAYIVLGRLYQVLEDYLAQVQRGPRIEIHSSVASFPEDAKTLDQVLEKIYE